jgi:hypothetical protein
VVEDPGDLDGRPTFFSRPQCANAERSGAVKAERVSGYSGTSLARKLGIKPGFRVRTKNAPAHYRRLLEPLPHDVAISPRLRADVDMCHLFTASRVELGGELERSLALIEPHGMIWVSWPKRASGVTSEVTEDTVRELALPLGLVDVKVCAVDETWSGLKLVVRRSERPER